MIKNLKSNFLELKRNRDDLLSLSQNLDTILVCLDNISNEILKDNEYRNLYLKFHSHTCEKRDFFNDKFYENFNKIF